MSKAETNRFFATRPVREVRHFDFCHGKFTEVGEVEPKTARYVQLYRDGELVGYIYHDEVLTPEELDAVASLLRKPGPPPSSGFWCDRFDGDLLKLVPSTTELLAGVDGVQMITRGNTTDGRLNGPSSWNSYTGLVAFFGFASDGTTGATENHVTSEPLVQCTASEMIRDAWVHCINVVVRETTVFNGYQLRGTMMDLLQDSRGNIKLSAEARHEFQRDVRNRVALAVKVLQQLAPEPARKG